MTDTELSKYIWELKKAGLGYEIKWKIIQKTTGFNKIANVCNLCTGEKLAICNFKPKIDLINKKNELVSKFRHENKHLLVNFQRSTTQNPQ